MRKKIGTLLIIGSLGALCAGLCACNNGSEVDNQFNNGNVISVTYDASGGEFLRSSSVSLIDMFNPNKYTSTLDDNGFVHIKLRSPTDPKRPNNGNPITVTRGEDALVGWYQERELDLKDGKVVDDYGNELTEKDGQYYLITTDEKGQPVETLTTPKYKYSKPWDFTKDQVPFKLGEKKLEMTLYAAWVKPYSFEYYYKANETDTEWKLYDTTTFNYMSAKRENDKADDDATKRAIDTIYIPKWSLGENGTGRMEDQYESFAFPTLEKKTFNSAYLDEACQNEITDSEKHGGDIDEETAAPVNPVKKIYVKFDEGMRYKIETAAQFAANANREGIYTILADELDFKCELSEEGGLNLTKESIRWPLGLMTTEFTGKIVGENGKPVTFKNVGAPYYQSTSATMGGLFGSIGKGAVIEGVTFENVIVDVQKASNSRGESNFGMLAGTIDSGAKLSVTIGGELHLGEITIKQSNFNLVANGDYTGVTKGDIVLKVYGAPASRGTYRFEIDPDTCTVDADGNITFEPTPFNNQTRETQYYTIQQNQTVNGGEENE